MSVQKNIEDRLVARFSPSFISVENESHRHSVGPGAETHFKVTLASAAFAGQTLVTRHRAVYEALAEPLKNGVHALAIHAYTEAEWEKQVASPASPHCRGGAGK